MSWLEDYNGEGARWWHVIFLLITVSGFLIYIYFFIGEGY